MRLIFVFTIYLGTCLGALSQTVLSESDPIRLYDQGREAYSLKSFALANGLLEEYLLNPGIAHQVEAEFFQGASLMFLGEKNGLTKLEGFVADYPQHPLSAHANFLLGQYWSREKNFEKAIYHYESVAVRSLTFEESEKIKFEMGYAYFMSDRFEKAVPFFDDLLNYQGDYFNDASYYLANIRFQQKAYQSALDLLEETTSGGKIEDRSVILMATILFQIEKYSRLYALATDQLTNAVNDANKELNKLCGEARYIEKSYPKAIEHFQRYLDLSGNRADANTYFKLGYAYYQNGNSDKSIDNFKKAGLAKGAIGEVSSFYLGKLYLQQKNLNYAYSAFKTVSEGQEVEHEAIREESSFLIGKINYERGVHDEAILDLMNFKTNYSKSRWSTDANEIMAQAYLKTSNYAQAISHLESIVNKTTGLKKAYQKVTIQQAQLLFNDSKFAEALKLLNKSVAYPEDRVLAAKGNYLKGECHSLLNQSQEAKRAYSKSISYAVSPWEMESSYSLAYLDYNDKAFDKALSAFNKYVKLASPMHEFYNDGLLRLADCYYVTKQYDRAITSYDRNKDNTAYVNYQKGLIYTLTSKSEAAIKSFNAVIDLGNENYSAKALFQLGELNMERSDFASAVDLYNRLLIDYPLNDLVPYVKSRQALCYVNMGNLKEAKANYLYLLDNHINHPVANSALLGLQEIIKQGEPVANFNEILSRYEQAHPDDSSLEVIAFEAAKTSFYDQKYTIAIDKLNAFIAKYPTSSFRLDALYFLGESYYRSESWQLASEAYLKVVNAGKSVYQTRSLDKRGKALLKSGSYGQAIQNYHLLNDAGSSAKELYLANEGLMTAYYMTNQYDSAKLVIEALVRSDWKPASAASKILLVKSKILIAEGLSDLALDELIQVVNDVQNENAAEAKYLIGKIYFEKGAHKNSLEILFDLNRSFGSYRYWVGKSFILIAKNYLKLDELLQARATLESVIKHTELSEIKEEAQALMREIQVEEELVLQQDTTQTDSIK